MPVDIRESRLKALTAATRHREFGKPTPVTRANSVPRVYIPYAVPGQENADGNVDWESPRVQFSPQVGKDAHLMEVIHPSTKDVRMVSRSEATRLLRMGWHPHDAGGAGQMPPGGRGRL